MTYRPHILLQFGGSFYGVEQWSCSLRIKIGGENSDPVGDFGFTQWEDWTRDNVQDVHTDVLAWVRRATSHVSSAANLDFVKLNVIDQDGRYKNRTDTVEFRTPAGTQKAGVATPTFPQVALCVSLLTDAQRGPGHRGRFFIPVGNIQGDPATGRLTNAVVAEVMTSTQTLLNDINNMPGIDVNNPRVVVASDLGAPGPIRAVTSLAIGNVADTQRRRRGEIAEVYQVLPVTIV